MSEQVKKAPAAKASPAVKSPKTLVPRTAPKAAPKPAAKVTEPVVAPAAASASTPAKAPLKTSAKAAATKTVAAKAKPVSKAAKVDETVAKHQKVLADALVQAQAINYDQPKTAKPVAAKPAKVTKAKKVKLVRDSYAMPDNEYVQIAALKKRLATLGNEVKKSELLRGGIAALAALNDAELKAVMGRIERIKTGRPAK